MTREEAIRILASSCIPGSKQTEALETLIPELAESEDERIRHWLIGLISADYKDENFPSGIKKTDVLNWLKKESVVYEQGMYYYDGKKFLYCQQEKPKVATPTLDSVKQNKSEDEEMLNSIINVVCGIDIQPSIGLREKQVRFLKSLKPYWKPSEEQMEALLNAEGFLRAGLQHDSAKTIAELYEHLKKLGVKEEPEYYQHFDPDC